MATKEGIKIAQVVSILLLDSGQAAPESVSYVDLVRTVLLEPLHWRGVRFAASSVCALVRRQRRGRRRRSRAVCHDVVRKLKRLLLARFENNGSPAADRFMPTRPQKSQEEKCALRPSREDKQAT
jgi:hypothetical protein